MFQMPGRLAELILYLRKEAETIFRTTGLLQFYPAALKFLSIFFNVDYTTAFDAAYLRSNMVLCMEDRLLLTLPQVAQYISSRVDLQEQRGFSTGIRDLIATYPDNLRVTSATMAMTLQ